MLFDYLVSAICSLTIRCETQLVAHHSGIKDIPEVITHCTIVVVHADLHSTLPLADCRLRTVEKSNLAIGTNCINQKWELSLLRSYTICKLHAAKNIFRV